MKVNARTDKFQHLEVFDKPALFTNGRIARDTVPKGWYCYDMRGSDDDPGELCCMEENVVVNHAGSVLMPEKLAMPKSGRLDVRDELGFLDEGNMTLRRPSGALPARRRPGPCRKTWPAAQAACVCTTSAPCCT